MWYTVVSGRDRRAALREREEERETREMACESSFCDRSGLLESAMSAPACYVRRWREISVQCGGTWRCAIVACAVSRGPSDCDLCISAACKRRVFGESDSERACVFYWKRARERRSQQDLV